MTKQFWTIDAETDPFLYGRVPKPFIWGAYNGLSGEYRTFKTTIELINFMKVKKHIFYAHNGGKFDFHLDCFADHINKNEKILIIGSRLVKAKIGIAEIRDSYALLPFPLKAMGAKLEIDYNKLEKNQREKHMPEIEEYLRADCVELWEAINSFFKTHGRHLTCASAAIKTLMKMEDLKIENSGVSFFDTFKPHYFGGRCQCFKTGEFHGELKYLDINSAYPYAMLHKHPIGNDFNYEFEKDPKIKGQNFYTIRAKSKGALCERTKTGLNFVNSDEINTFHTTGWEVLAGLETKTLEIIEHIEQKIFVNLKSFENYINHFWDERKKHSKNSHLNLFAKLMMNSAYGKFAANPDNYDTYVLFEPNISEFLINNGWELRGELGNAVLASRKLEEENARYYNVATGASITGFVRSMLLRVINNVENPIYCDTDSIIFTGNYNIDLGKDLGQWDFEGIYNEGYFAGKKLYAVKNEKEIKLASKGTRLNFEQIKAVALGETLEYNFEAPTFSWKNETKFTTRNIRKTAQ